MKKPETQFIARAFITHDNKILVCENKKGGHYFLPGGHIEFGESVKNALIREIMEELGVEGEVGNMAGVFENKYQLGDSLHHEINIIFSASLSTNNVKSLEDHIAFHWIRFEDIHGINLLPSKLPEIISEWLKDKKTFFESTI
jgi:ADP-ribose pyrophosphatase YjhB (NUDIX family)